LKYTPASRTIDGVVECTASLITWVRLVSPIGGDTDVVFTAGNLSTNLSCCEAGGTSNICMVFSANCYGTIIYNNLVLVLFPKKCIYYRNLINFLKTSRVHNKDKDSVLNECFHFIHSIHFQTIHFFHS
jgi:hypothetical protein